MKSIVGYDCDEELSSWDLPAILSKLHIVKESYQGTTYEGNQCRQILKSITKLQIPLVLKPFESALHALDDLVRMCYKEELPMDYGDIINKFKKHCMILVVKFNMNISNKLHIIFDHLQDYYDYTNLSLIKTGDELIESMHQYVDKRMQKSNYMVKDYLNPRHGEKLYRAVLHLNGYNIVFDNDNKDDEY